MSALPLQESKIQPAASSPSRSLCLNIAIKHDASSDLDEQKQRSSSGTYAKKSDDGGTFVPLTELSSARKRRRVWSNEVSLGPSTFRHFIWDVSHPSGISVSAHRRMLFSSNYWKSIVMTNLQIGLSSPRN